MPQEPKHRDGWIQVNQPLPAQRLDTSEVQPFLNWIFGDLAVKRKRFKLRETAAVARYLAELATHGVPTKIVKRGRKAIQEYWLAPQEEVTRTSRRAVKKTAEIVWGNLFQLGQFDPATKQLVKRFLRKHSASVYHPWIEHALTFLEECELVPSSPASRRSPNFVASGSFQERGNPYLEDDLSERIAAADSALRQSGIEDRQKLIADVLTISPLTEHLRPKGDSWGPVEVRERVKTYHRQKHSIAANQLANKWILRYRMANGTGAPRPADKNQN